MGEGVSISNEKVLGEQILARIDRLIEVLIAVELKNPQEARQSFEEGRRLVAELYGLLEQFIGPHHEYMESAVKELVTQRIPDRRLLQGFSGFTRLLDEVCKQTGNSDLQTQDHEDAPDAGAPTSKDKVERALNLIFPRETVWKRHRYNGVYFDYYLPFLKIAVEEGGYHRGTENALKEYLCRRDGIRVAMVDNSIAGYREIARQIKRQLVSGA